MSKTKHLLAAVAAALALSGGPAAMAQAPGQFANEESSWLVWAIFGGAALLICATGFMNPKRSHLN